MAFSSSFLHFGSLIISIFGESWNLRFKGTYFLVAHFMHFGSLKMPFLPIVKVVVWALCRHFGHFRIRFLLNRNTKGLRVPSFLWPHFLHFVGLKMRISLGSDTQLLVIILTAWNFYRCRFVKTTVQGYLELCELIFCFLAAWKCLFYRVWRSSCEPFVGILGTSE